MDDATIAALLSGSPEAVAATGACAGSGVCMGVAVVAAVAVAAVAILPGGPFDPNDGTVVRDKSLSDQEWNDVIERAHGYMRSSAKISRAEAFARAIDDIKSSLNPDKAPGKPDRQVTTKEKKEDKVVHGNSLDSPKPTRGDALVDAQGNIVKYGQTSLGTRRYSAEWLRNKGLTMKFLTRPISKKDARAWETEAIRKHESEHGGRPSMNSNYD